MSHEDPLRDLFDQTVEALLAKIKSGEATAAELAVAVKLLKDNNITARPSASPHLKELVGQMPEFKDDWS